MPSVYRKKNEEKKLMLKERFELLKDKVLALQKLFRDSAIKYAGTSLLNKYPEIAGHSYSTMKYATHLY